MTKTSCYSIIRFRNEVDSMRFDGTFDVTIKTGDSSFTETFENEKVDISRSGRLGIINKNEGKSDLFESLKEWYEQDRKNKVQSHLNIKTSPSSAIESFREYYIQSINDDKQMIILNWVGNY
jgi:virulence-associated protein VagC